MLGALGADPSEVRDRLSSSYLVAVAAESIRAVSRLRAGAGRAGEQHPTLTMHVDVRFGTPDRQQEFARELADALARLVQRYHDPEAAGGRTFTFALLGHPKA